MHAIVVLITATGLLSDNPVVPLLLGGLLVGPTLIVLGILEARRTPLRIDPLSFLLFWNAVDLGIAATYIGWKVSSGEWLDFSVALISRADLAKGYVIYLLGILSMHVGLQYMRPVQQSPATRWSANFNPLPFIWLVAIWGLGLAYLLKSVWFGFLGNLVQPLHWAALAAVTIFALVPRRYFGISKPMFGSLFTIGILGLLVANLATGSKAYITFSFLPLVWMVIVRRDLWRWGGILALGLVAAYFGAIAPTLQNSRQEPPGEGEGPLAHIISSFRVFGWSDSTTEPKNSLSDQAEAFLVRQFDSTPTGFLVGEVRKDGLQWGQTMQYAAYAFVPRLLWPDKPNVSRGAWFTMYLGASNRESESTSSTGITAVGELYWNFGIPGVVIGMLGIGLGYGLLWRMAGENPVHEPLHMILYVSVVIGGMTDMPEAVTVYAGILSQMILFGALFYVLRVGRRKFPQR
ncbi:MAG: hypothetical protein DMG76_31255 [Acidobacteria bacterium]|nr:MAG: hypothetical protein DMG76_31255 [Acidobacteriota bacterium]